jgi:CHAT domain-containing protein
MPGKEFAGFGNPVLQGIAGKEHDVSSIASARKSGIANVEQIRQAPSLPETETELKVFANALNAPTDSVRVGENATETLVKKADLTRYGVLAFATHGVMAGELPGMQEPGLILTPPAQGNKLDDGYLSASEVAQLKLNADWVVLSACNTAAPDGQPEAEGLSGLAKAFFYAGARSLLVSNWYVASDAATQLTTEMFELYKNKPGIGKAEALRLAMHKLREDPDFAQPMFWAPFSVVGEGG